MNTWSVRWMISLPCHISQKRFAVLNSIPKGPPEILVSGRLSKSEPVFQQLLFHWQPNSMKLRDGAKNIWNRQKGPISRHKWNTAVIVDSCATFLALSQVTKLSVVSTTMLRSSERPYGLWGDQLFAFWISFFNPYTLDGSPEELTSTANVHKPVSSTLAPVFVFCFCFSD